MPDARPKRRARGMLPRRRGWTWAHGLLSCGLATAVALRARDAAAGPPYATDDPEPVEHRHWELYVASQSAKGADGWSVTAPHVEVNYGLAPDLQLHVIVPMTVVSPTDGPKHYGLADTELGAKLRFVHESKYVPQVGTFPFVELPTGSKERGLGNGSPEVFVLLWIQKSLGAWTSYGGGGYWLHPGVGNRNWWFFGWQLQRRLVDEVTIGVELFHSTAQADEASAETRFNVGAQLNLSDSHHVLLSASRGLTGPNTFQGYVAYQITVGPK